MAKGSVNGSANVSNISDTVARVTVSGSYSFGPWYYWGVRVRAYANGQEVASAAGYTTSTYQTTAWCEGYLDVPRGTSDYTLTWTVTSEGETVSGYGSLGESDSRSGSVTINAIPVYAPEEPTEPEITRDSDNQVTLSWTNNVSATKPYAAITVYRAVNGGAWSDLATVGGSVTSYIDQTTNTDNAYSYRVKGKNAAGESAVCECGTVYNTPNAPAAIEWAREAGTNVTLTLTNGSNTATALEIESRPDGSDTWSAVGTVDGLVTETTVSLGGGQFYVRVRNTRGDMKSDWLESTKIVTLVAPNAPTLKTPASSAVVSKSNSSVSLTWTHNPLDGSTQTAAQVRYKVNSGSYTTQTVTTAQSYSLSLASIPVNASVTWSVRTKGAHEDYSAWSAERSFTVRQVPTVNITTPTSTIVATPLHYAFAYSDDSGTLQAATLTISNASGTLYSKNIGTATSGTIPRDELLLPDLGTYTLEITAQSTSTLTTSANSTFLVEYEKPKSAEITKVYDAENGVVNIGVDPLEDGADGLPVATYDVQRTSSDGGWLTLARDLAGHSDVLDRYAPCNKDYQYRVVTYADSGAFRETVFDSRFNTPYWYLMAGNFTAKAKYNPSASESIECADYSTVRYAGRTFPVLYDSGQKSDTYKAGGILTNRGEVDAFRDFQLGGGKGVYKSNDGDVVHVHGATEYSRNIGTPSTYEVTCTMERIDGGGL